MKEGMREELADFLRFCASERRLAPMTCSAYERDVSVCLDYLQGQGIEDLAESASHTCERFWRRSRSAGRPSRARREQRRR